MANITSNIKDYLETVMTDILPASAIQSYKLNKIGLYNVPSKNTVKIKDELPNSKGIYAHEKCTPDRYLLQNLNKENAYNPIYFRFFNDPSIISALGKIIVNSALQLYPTPLNTYGMIRETPVSHSIGVATIDLNHLVNSQTGEHIDSCRLDMFLHKSGFHHEINSFMDFQNLIKNEAFVNQLTPRAIVQLGLSSIFIPNAIGETDANSRNIILLKSNNDEKYDTVVRIDAESNTYLNDQDRTRSGNKVVPKGIYTANESQDEFLQNISSKAIGVDWNLFMGFTLLAQKATSRTSIDNAITKAYMLNSGKLDTSSILHPTSYLASYNQDAFYSFSEATIDRAERFSNNVLDALGGRWLSGDPPFAEQSNAYPRIVITKDEPVATIAQEEHSFDQEQ